jgi:amino acid transporter
VNCLGIRLTARLNDFSVWWHIAGVAVIVGLLVFLGRHHNPPGFLFSAVTVTNPLDAASAEIGGRSVPALVIGDWKLPSPLFGMLPFLAEVYRAAPFALVGVLALLQAQWTYTGYDASAHVAEETVMARKNSAWGIFLSVAVSAVVGYALLLALTWCIPNGNVAATSGDTYPVLQIARENLPVALSHTVAIIIGAAMWLCGCSSISSMGRMWYAFARDGGMVGSEWLKQVHPRFRTPVPAILLTSVLAVLLCVYAAAFTVVTSISTIALYLAYVLPVYLNWRNRRSGKGEYTTPETAPWNLGRWGPLVRGIAILYTLFIVVVFVLPPNELVLWTTLLMGILLTAYWLLSARRHFTGPTPGA